MYAYIKGSLESIEEDNIVVDVQNIGYELKVPNSVIAQLPPIGDEVKLYTYLYVREDAMNLFAFLTKDDLDVFKKLLTVNGIGPKGALGILSAINPDDLRFAILSEDADLIATAPGIGKKTASKLIIELKDKFKIKNYQLNIGKNVSDESLSSESVTHMDVRQDAIAALVSLGYSNLDASKAVRKVHTVTTLELLIKDALKLLYV